MYLCTRNYDLKRGGTFETAKAGTFHSVTAGTSIPLFTSQDYIPQDSTANYAEFGSLFSHNKEHKGYLFVIKLETARNHTWAEICNEHLYDTLFVTREMLKQGNRIEYHGNKTNNH